MNLFRSEEHARRWAQFNPASDPDGFIALTGLAMLFGTESRRNLLADDYISRWFPRRRREREETLARLGKTSAFWSG
jgi:hypothetical protein